MAGKFTGRRLLGTYEGQHPNWPFLTISPYFCSLQNVQTFPFLPLFKILLFLLYLAFFQAAFLVAIVVAESKFKMVVGGVDKYQLGHNRTTFSYVLGALKFSPQMGRLLSFREYFRTAIKARVSEVRMT